MSELHIDIYSDVICPWCYIGKQRLDQVLSGPDGEGVTVRWRAYQLQPRIPEGGIDRLTYLKSRYGEGADAARVPLRILAEATEEGLALDFAAIERMPNTFVAHRLMWFAFEQGGEEVQHRLAGRLFEAYFRDGEDVEDRSVLVRLGGEAGLVEAEVSELLASGEGAEAVREELAQAVDVGVSGVPCYVLGGMFPFPGAQTAEVMGQFVRRAKERLGG